MTERTSQMARKGLAAELRDLLVCLVKAQSEVNTLRLRNDVFEVKAIASAATKSEYAELAQDVAQRKQENDLLWKRNGKYHGLATRLIELVAVYHQEAK